MTCSQDRVTEAVWICFPIDMYQVFQKLARYVPPGAYQSDMLLVVPIILPHDQCCLVLNLSKSKTVGSKTLLTPSETDVVKPDLVDYFALPWSWPGEHSL